MPQKGQPTASALGTGSDGDLREMKLQQKNEKLFALHQVWTCPPTAAARAWSCACFWEERGRNEFFSLPLGLRDGNTGQGRSRRTQLPRADNKH